MIIYGTSIKYTIALAPMTFILFLAFVIIYILLVLPRSLALGRYLVETLASNNNYVALKRLKQVRYMNLRNVRSISVSQGKYRSRSFDNLRFGEPPEITEEIRVEVAERYIRAFEEITREAFVPEKLSGEEILKSIAAAVNL